MVWSQLLRCLAINVGEIKRFNAPKAALELLGHRIDLFACVEQWTPPPGTASASVEAARLGQSRLLAATPGADGRPADGAGSRQWRCGGTCSRSRAPQPQTRHRGARHLPPPHRPGARRRRAGDRRRRRRRPARSHDLRLPRGEVRRLAQPTGELDAAELSTLLGRGELAGPMRRFDGEAEVHTQLRALCEPLPSTSPPPLRGRRRGATEAPPSISAFVEAFARVLRHVGGGAVDAPRCVPSSSSCS